MPLITSSPYIIPPVPLTPLFRALGGGSSEYGRAIAMDGSNPILVGQTDSQGAGGLDALVVKYDSSGNVTWQRALGGGSTEIAWGVAVDSSSNIYVTGETQSVGVSFRDVFIAKYDSSGTIQWQRALGGTGSSAHDRGYDMAVDTANNIYIVGRTSGTVTTSDDILLAKYDSSGAIQWQRALGLGTTQGDIGTGIIADSSNNIYITGSTKAGAAAGDNLVIAKYDSSGAIQWQRSLSGSLDERGEGIVVDSSNNVYISGYTNSEGAGSADVITVKYDSSGAIQWQRRLGAGGSDSASGIAIDSSSNVYVAGATANVSNDFIIAKYNSFGAIQWQRRITGSGFDQAYGIAHDGSGNIYLSGVSTTVGAGGADLLMIRLPDDGSGTGTYGSLTYETISYTEAAAGLTDQSVSMTDQSISFTDQSVSMTDQATTLTETTIP